MFFQVLYGLATVMFAFLITQYLIPLFNTIAFQLNVLDKPDGRLKVHTEPVPYFGGLAVFGGIMATLALFFPFHTYQSIFFVGMTLLLFLGLIDDIAPLTPLQKFLGQMIAGICFLKAGLYLKEVFFDAHNFALSWTMKFISFGWILTVINALNLIDIMDGLATTVTIGACISFLIFAVLLNLGPVIILLLAAIGSLIAFFLVNRPPSARMYLGDAGALFLGGLLATVPFMIPWGSCSLFGVLAPLTILTIPLLEVASLIVIRTYLKIPFYLGSPHHFAILLRAQGYSKVQVLAFVAFFQSLLFGVAFCTWKGFFSFPQWFFGFFTLIVFWFFVLFSWTMPVVAFFRKLAKMNSYF